MRRVPETQKTADWPRKVAQSIGSIINAVTTAQGNITTLQTDVTAAEGDISTLQTDVSAAETNITALQTATDWSALADYADDSAAATGGVAVGELYRTGSTVKVRVS